MQPIHCTMEINITMIKFWKKTNNKALFFLGISIFFFFGSFQQIQIFFHSSEQVTTLLSFFFLGNDADKIKPRGQ